MPNPAPVSAVADLPVEVLPLEYGQRPATSRFRWVILFLLFVGMTINYVDRLVIGLLAPDLQKQYGISDSQYGWIGWAFALSYACGQLVSGGLLDRFGTRLGYGVALIGWSAASMFHAMARSAMGFGVMRALLGVAESPAYPASTKTIAEWFPKKERALAMGFVNAGGNVGAVVAPAVVPWLAHAYGWQWAFIATGGIGLLFVLVWIPVYRRPAEHSRVSASELAYINSDPPEPTGRIRWVTLLSYRQAWAFAIAKFLTDSMWWFYMTWFPKFLNKEYGLDLLHIGLPLIVVYLLADIGSIGGGWMSSAMIKRGVSVNRARKTAMLLPALAVTPIMFASDIRSMWTAVAIMGLTTASHQAFSSNLYTLVSDTFPKRAVASVAGLGGTFGYVGASLFQLIVGYSVEQRHNYLVPFVCSGLAYLVAFGVIQWLAPKLEPALVGDDEQRGFPVVSGR